jgi:hypothetical protein
MRSTHVDRSSPSALAIQIRKGGIIAIAAFAVICLILAVGLTTGLIGIHLPPLTGPFAVGRINIDLIDPARQEVFVTSPQSKRAIVITIYYPAHPPASATPAPYTSGKMAELLAAKARMPTFALQLVHSHAFEHVPIAAGTFPVVLGRPPASFCAVCAGLFRRPPAEPGMQLLLHPALQWSCR